MVKKVELDFHGRPLSIEVGRLAKQADGAALVQYGETVVLVTAVAAKELKMEADFFPLTVDYQEKTFAAGKIPGGFFKREGRPSEKEVLTSRLIDRPIRPLFPEWFHDGVQVQAFVLAADRENDPDVLAMIAASAALSISPLPFLGPIGAVRVGYIDGQFVPFPGDEQLESSDLDLVVSGSNEAMLMIEGFAREMREETMLEALGAAHGFVRQVVELQKELIEKVQPVKATYEIPPPDALADLLDQLGVVLDISEQLLQDIVAHVLHDIAEQQADLDLGLGKRGRGNGGHRRGARR